jgi:DASH complex subunit DAM1
MSEFVDETEALQANVEGMKNLSDSLATFNESFASWLYIMNMNALTTDWPQVWCSNPGQIHLTLYSTQAPVDASFEIAKRRAGIYILPCASLRPSAQTRLENDALAAMEALKAQAAASREVQAAADRTAMTEATEAEITYAANTTTTNTSGPVKASGGVKKKVGKPKLSAKEKKERSVRAFVFLQHSWFSSPFIA